ncbi:hypothetical protein BJV78DRAFT_1275785 [Lactifluus subvellereus]|nr:hypothetical protein BJV78DRAFT_1275785 [Lactifluus subvellereus]
MLYSSTVLARNAASILTHISRLPAELAAHPLLFTLSTNTPISSLSPLVSALSSLSSSGSVGCLSAASHSGAPIGCSLAFFRKEDATLFRSDMPGRPETQVGRWHAMRKKGKEDDRGVDVGLTENVDWERIWSRSLEGDVLPLALRELSGRKEDVHTIITLSDNAPQGLNESLSFFSHATKVLRPFWFFHALRDGRPYTLMYNGSVNSSGAVGLALSAGPRPALQTAFYGLRAISEPLKVTRAEGNLVNELDNMNPTTLLISAIEKSALTGLAAKDDEFYLGVLRDGNLWEVHHIMSGGPSRGTMALETETAPGEGSSVQLFHRPNDDVVPTVWPRIAKNTLTFLAVQETDSTPVEEGKDMVTIVEDAFVAASENGFMASRCDEATWTCIAPGATAQLAW